MKSKNRTLLLVFTLAVVAILAALGCLWYLTAHMDRSGWVQQNGYYYYLNEKGEPTAGWLTDGQSRYYFGYNCAMVTGWQEIDGQRYFFGPDGVMRTGWQEIEGQRRYFHPDGTCARGWESVDGQRRYFVDDGLPASGWQNVDGLRCFFSQEGTLVTGWLEQDEGTYYLNDRGAPVTGLTTLEGRTYYFFQGSGLMAQGLLDLEDGRYFFGEDGTMQTGWQTLGEDTFYFAETGAMQTGWQTLGEDTFYFAETGAMHTGWLQEGEYSYYFTSEGPMATTPTVIDGETCYFTPTGIYILLVNYQNPMPQHRQPKLVRYGEWARVAAIAEQSLRQMILDCRATGIECWLNCGYRTQDEQQQILDNRTEEYMEKGLSQEEAYQKALETVALPGYSEHETGLAMDIVCSVAPTWLHEHCWEYGFILRYPENKTEITGISYEHWHYRYVGTKVSMAMKDTGLCLEEYVGAA